MKRRKGRKISMVTCYDYSSARAMAESSVHCILGGDSLAMTITSPMYIDKESGTRTTEGKNLQSVHYRRNMPASACVLNIIVDWVTVIL